MKSAFTIELRDRLIPRLPDRLPNCRFKRDRSGINQLPHDADDAAIANEPFAMRCRPVSEVVVARARMEGVPK